MSNPSQVARNQASTRKSFPTWAKIVAGLIVLICGFVYLNASGQLNLFAAERNATPSKGEEVRRLPVSVRPAKFVKKIEQPRRYTGTIRARQKASLGFELTGRVAAVLVDEGDVVDKGQTLATLDSQTLEARKSAIVASLEQANAVLDELVAGPRQERIDSMRAQLKEANSDLKLAQLDLDRRINLRGSGVSEAEYDRALYNQQSASARMNSTKRQLDEMTTGTRPEKIAAQRAAINQLKSSVQEIEIQIEKSSILAPFSGKIVKRMIDPGTIATASIPVMEIVDVNNLEAVIGIPIAAAQHVDVDQPYSIIVGGQNFPARLMAKIQELESSTRTQNLIFQLDDHADGRVIPGQLGQIEIVSEVDVEGFLVPTNSLTNGIRGLWSIMVVDPNNSRVSRADVQIAYSDESQTLVTGPLNDGDQIIVNGTHRIVEGQFVQAVNRSGHKQ